MTSLRETLITGSSLPRTSTLREHINNQSITEIVEAVVSATSYASSPTNTVTIPKQTNRVITANKTSRIITANKSKKAIRAKKKTTKVTVR